MSDDETEHALQEVATEAEGIAHSNRRQPSAAQLRERIEFQETLLSALADIGIQQMVIEDGRIIYVGNRALAREFGFTDAMIDAHPPLESILHPEDRARILDYHRRRLAGESVPGSYELALVTRSGERRVFEAFVSVVPGSRPPRIISIGIEITERKRAAAAREELFRSLVENLPDMIVRYDRELRRTYVNPAFERFAGCQAHTVVGHSPLENWVTPGDDQERTGYLAALKQVVDTRQPTEKELNAHRTDGTPLITRARYIPELDQDGELIGVLAVGQDITAQRAMEDRLRIHEAHLQHVAYHDDLTGLPNRLLLRERLTEAINLARRNGRKVAILYLDLDGFKPTNDVHGHATGDLLLQAVARRLADIVRSGDVVARIGGDEFVAMLADLPDPQECGSIAHRFLDAINEPIVVDGRCVTLSASMGVSLYPDDEQDPDTLLRCADHAMYSAKAAGRNQLVFYGTVADGMSPGDTRMIHDLREALELDQLTVHYQPIVDIATGRIVKAEALARWMHPSRGAVPPSVFIPVAENSGLIHAIGDRVFRHAARVAMEWNRRVSAPADALLRICVNRSPRQFVNREGAQGWVKYLAGEGISGQMLSIEITEGLLLEDRTEVFGQLEQMQAFGMTVSLDDFGTGYSSLSYLKKFDIDCIKIDRSFIRDITVDESDRAIVEAIIAIGKRLGIKLIAEGVETRAQAELLCAAGCDMAQGYFFARPMPEEQFLAFATSGQKFDFQAPMIEFTGLHPDALARASGSNGR